MLRTFLATVMIAAMALIAVSASSSPAEEPPVVDSEIRELLIEKRDALNQRFTLVKARFANSTLQYDKVILAHESVLLAELELATTPEQRIQICKKRVENFQHLERRLAADFQSGQATVDAKLQATVNRIQAQIDLLRQSSPRGSR